MGNAPSTTRDGTLAPYAATSTCSKGRRYPEPAPAYRNEYQRDRDRIIHSAAFRRLESQTFLLNFSLAEMESIV